MLEASVGNFRVSDPNIIFACSFEGIVYLLIPEVVILYIRALE